jgi:hypothetical protein
MKFMDRVMTPNGAGLVIGKGEAGTVLVSIARRDAVGVVCQGPCVNVFVKEEAISQQPTAVSGRSPIAPTGGGNGR